MALTRKQQEQKFGLLMKRLPGAKAKAQTSVDELAGIASQALELAREAMGLPAPATNGVSEPVAAGAN